MTANEIIKALEDEIHLIEYVDGFSADNVSLELLQNSLDLINRQKAEIDRLKEFIVETRRCDKEIKSEAIKEFVERLKMGLFEKCCINYTETLEVRKYIDNLIKEMVGDTDD